MIRAVVFDVDGTLVDTVDLHAAAWTETFKRFGVDAEFAEVRTQIGKGGDQLMPVFLPAQTIEARREEIERFRSELYKRDHLPKARPFPGVRALFERLRADGRKIVIGSSCKADELDHYLGLVGVTDLIDGAATGDDAEHSKPFPDIFQAALAQLDGVEPADAAVVGDSPFDAHAALAAGMKAVGVLCGGFPENDLRAAGFVEVHRDPEALLASYEHSVLGRSK
jgi:HAD superfamily hydrolase (TIGR01509 family)